MLLSASTSSVIVRSVRANCYRACVASTAGRPALQRFPLRLVGQDGATWRVHAAAEPRHVFALPLDIARLSEDERRQKLAARKPKKEAVKAEVIDDNFDATVYLELFERPKQNEKRKISAKA